MGIQVVKREDIRPFLATCSPQEIPGIGRRLSKRIKHLRTILDYINEPQEKIRKLLHKPGEQFWYELQGTILFPVQAKRPERKAISRGGSIWGYYKDSDYIWGFLMRNLERLVDQLTREDIEISELTLLLITAEGATFQGKVVLPDFTNNFSFLLKALRQAFKQAFRRGYSYGYVHIIGYPLRSHQQKQLNLFTDEDEKYQQLLLTKQQLNRKYGRFTLRSGATLFVPQVFADETSNYEICDIEGKICF